MMNGLEMINFKSFAKSTLDFTQKNNKAPKNLISIYGENGSGKSNIVDAFRILKFSTLTTSFSERFTKFQSLLSDKPKDREKMSELENIQEMVMALKYKDLSSLLENTPRINSDGDTSLIYHFTIDDIEGSYEISYDRDCNLNFESLYYLINKRRGKLFTVKRNEDNLEFNLSNDIFKTMSIRKELKDTVLKLWGKHTFISIFKQLQQNINGSYIDKNISNNFIDVIEEFEKIVIWTDEVKGPFVHGDPLLSNLADGSIEKNEAMRLNQSEEVIFSYLSSLYADIKDVKYKVRENGSKIDYQLYIIKNISGETTEIPFYLESNGTKNLLELLQVFFSVVNGSIVIVDEIDQGIHDILMNNIIKNVSESISGQLIFTTHDTFLLRELPASSAYFINLDVMGNKLILSGNDYDKKVLKNNNMQSMYLKGLFNAVPDPIDIDFDEIFEPFSSLTV